MQTADLPQTNTQKLYWQRIAPALLMLIFSFVVSNYAGRYATIHASTPASDLLLDKLPIYNVNFMHIALAISFWISVFA